MDRLAAAPGCGLAGQMRVLRRLDRQHLCRPGQRERECTQPRKQIGHRRAPPQPLAHRTDQYRLAIGSSLHETIGRERDRHAR